MPLALLSLCQAQRSDLACVSAGVVCFTLFQGEPGPEALESKGIQTNSKEGSFFSLFRGHGGRVPGLCSETRFHCRSPFLSSHCFSRGLELHPVPRDALWRRSLTSLSLFQEPRGVLHVPGALAEEERNTLLKTSNVFLASFRSCLLRSKTSKASGHGLKGVLKGMK